MAPDSEAPDSEAPDSEGPDSGAPDSGPEREPVPTVPPPGAVVQDSSPPPGPLEPSTVETAGARTHPITILVQGSLWSVAAFGGLLVSNLSGGGDRWGPLPWWAGGLSELVVALVFGMLAGAVSWSFTRYVIDGTELRQTQGLLFRSSRRVPYERIQSVDIAEPFVARLFSVAELRIEAAGGATSRTSLRYLPLEECRRLRRLLLVRAGGSTHGGTPGGFGDDDAAPGTNHGDGTGSTIEDLELITRVPGRRIVLGTVLSLDFVASAGIGITLLVAVLWFDTLLALLGGAAPLAVWAFRIISGRVFAQWDFTLARTGTGLRIERGLFSRTSQTIPFSRVQGVALSEPALWRRYGWARLDVDVAGYAGQGDAGAGGAESSSTLLPIGRRDLALAVLTEVIPGAEADGPTGRVAASPASRPFAPIGWRYRWIAADEVSFVDRSGWVERSTDVVPHARTQSVELRQGPWQRRRGVATVGVHTPDGPVNAEGRHLAAPDARAVVFAQLTRARAARGEVSHETARILR